MTFNLHIYFPVDITSEQRQQEIRYIRDKLDVTYPYQDFRWLKGMSIPQYYVRGDMETFPTKPEQIAYLKTRECTISNRPKMIVCKPGPETAPLLIVKAVEKN